MKVVTQTRNRLLRWTLTLIIPVIGVTLVLVGLQVEARVGVAQPAAAALAPALQPSYLFRFNPTNQSFYTYSLPLDSLPHGVAVTGTNPTHIWVAESGRNRIGHLIYTNTNNVQWVEYPVTSTANSQPFKITVDGNNVWFTERGANRIGRLNAVTGAVDEFFTGLSANSNLADIRVAPNGQVWAAGQGSNRLIQLTVTSTVNYAFREYTHTLLAGPFGLFIESNNAVWLTAPGAHRLGRLTPSTGAFLWPFSFPADSAPTEIVVTPAFAWFSDFQRNAIGQLEIGTLTNLNYYTPTVRPASLAGESLTRFWFTQQSPHGAVGRLIYTSTVSTQLDSYPLPTSGLYPTDIGVAADGGVWFGAFQPVSVFLPVAFRN